MIREIYHFFQYGPKTQKRRRELGLVEFLKSMAKELDADGYAELRTSLVGDPQAKVTAIEPNEELRAAAGGVAKGAKAEIRVLPGAGEGLPFGDATFDVVSASLVLCSVASPRHGPPKLHRPRKHP